MCKNIFLWIISFSTCVKQRRNFFMHLKDFLFCGKFSSFMCEDMRKKMSYLLVWPVKIFFFMCEKMPNIVLPDTCETFCGRIFIFWVRVLKKIWKLFFFFLHRRICFLHYNQLFFLSFIFENIRELFLSLKTRKKEILVWFLVHVFFSWIISFSTCV